MYQNLDSELSNECICLTMYFVCARVCVCVCVYYSLPFGAVKMFECSSLCVISGRKLDIHSRYFGY